jgi:hypothetical protein
VLALSSPECSSTAANIISAQAKVEAECNSTVETVTAALDSLKAKNGPDYTAQQDSLRLAVQRIRRGRLSDLRNLGITGPAGVMIARLDAAYAQLELTISQMSKVFHDEQERFSAVSLEVACDDRFREAILWQNRRAWHTGIERYLQETGPRNSRNSKQRQREELIANYLQRFCVKNDTIGFFGPVGWAKFGFKDGKAMSVEPGPTLIASRSVDFEAWAIDAVAEAFLRTDHMRLWAAPRRVPYLCSYQGTFLLAGMQLPLSAQEVAVLNACNGRQMAKDIANHLLAIPHLEFSTAEEVYNLLASLCQRGFTQWGLDLPLEKKSERSLQRLIERIEAEQLRKPALDALTALENSRAAVAQAGGDPFRLDQALENLEQTFIRITEVAPTRAAGQAYAARTLVYEDCRRDVEVNLGSQLLCSLKDPLSLLLTSARWLTFEIAKVYREVFRSIYNDLVRKTRSPIIDGAIFWSKIEPLFFSGSNRLANQYLPMFQKRWANILLIPPGQNRVLYSSEQLRPAVEAVFAAPRAGWSHAKYHCPDLMIAARDPEAIRRGEYEWIFSELHVGVNTLNEVLFFGQHPNPEELARFIQADFPQARIEPVPPKNFRPLTIRTAIDFVPPGDYRLEISPGSLAPAGSKALPIGALVVEAVGEDLMLRTRDGDIQFEIVEAFGECLSYVAVHSFAMFSQETRYRPRITIDRVIICRECWRFSSGELDFAFQEKEMERFIALRRWKQAWGLPRFLFAKVPVETKPFYVDLDSPVYATILAKMIRRTREQGQANSLITLSEMIPQHSESWLPDSQGNHYTSELRMVAVDMRA